MIGDIMKRDKYYTKKKDRYLLHYNVYKMIPQLRHYTDNHYLV